MKKLAKFAIATLLTAVMAIGFAACGTSGNVDTFEGAISNDSYESQESAVEAFLDNEIAGDAVQAELQDIQEVGELTTEEVAALDTGDALAEGDTIVSAKIVEVSYTRITSNALSLAAETGDDVFVFTVYVIEISPAGTTVTEFRYYVPKAENGDVLTRSYFEDVLDPAKYVNCTQKYTAKSTSMGITMTIEYSILCANDKATLQMKIPDMNSSMSIEYTNIYGYFEDGESFKAWLSTDGTTYAEAPAGSFAQYGVIDMESFATLCIPKIDYSYFEKTSYGFKIQEAFLETYIGDVLGYYGGSGVSAELKFYVKDGRLSEVKSNVSATMEGLKVTSTETVKFSAFGTTTVNRPASIG